MPKKLNSICHIFKDPAISSHLLDGLTSRLSECFSVIGLEVPDKIHDYPPPSSCFDASRHQYKASDLVNTVVEDASRNRETAVSGRDNLVLYLLAADAYTPKLNFVFGVAHTHQGCMVTLYRLENDKDFIFKECVHELGHVFGLKHCQLPCVMTFSNSVHEAHQKSVEFCDKCQTVLKQYLEHW